MKGVAFMNCITKECKDCGVSFDITAEEQEWYKKKNFQLPERCPNCRKMRRQNRDKKIGGYLYENFSIK